MSVLYKYCSFLLQFSFFRRRKEKPKTTIDTTSTIRVNVGNRFYYICYFDQKALVSFALQRKIVVAAYLKSKLFIFAGQIY